MLVAASALPLILVASAEARSDSATSSLVARSPRSALLALPSISVTSADARSVFATSSLRASAPRSAATA